MSQTLSKSILKAASILGTAQLINVFLSVVRNKIIATTIGPAGLGLIGLYTQVIQTVGMVGSIGIGAAGTQQIASNRTNDNTNLIGEIKLTIFIALLFLSLCAGLAFPIILVKFPNLTNNFFTQTLGMEWLSLGVVAIILISYQSAVLTGLSRIKQLALISVIASFVGTLISVASLFIFEAWAVIIITISTPIVTLICGLIFTSRSENYRWSYPRGTLSILIPLLKLGFPLMASSAVGMIGFIIVRLAINNESGADGLGLYQASWMIGVTYLGFILNSMASDYFPRLTKQIHDHPAATEIVNNQTKLLLLLSSPLILLTITFAPNLMKVLYSSQFVPAASVLKWHILSDILKCAAWPLSYVIIAKNKGFLVLFLEIVSLLIMISVTWLALPYYGVSAAGIALVLMYGGNLILVYYYCRFKLNFRWERSVAIHLFSLFFCALLLIFILDFHQNAGYILGCFLSIISFIWCLRSLLVITDALQNKSVVNNRFKLVIARLLMLPK